MTAEAAVLNRSAVALAADSKATVRLSSGIKSHDTANKLFALSKHQPIGVMINGNAEFMRIPWETIIKVYRDRLGRRALPSLVEYADDFLLSLTSDYTHSQAMQLQNATFIVVDFLVEMRDRIDELLRRARSIDEAIADALEVISRNTSAMSVLTAFADITDEDVQTRYQVAIDTAIKSVFEDLSRPLTEAERKGISECSARALRRPCFSESQSELVVAGFGDDEIFPSVKAWTVDGVVADRLRFLETQNVAVSADGQDAVVIPFAQREMVDRFMMGIDPDFLRYLTRTSRTIVSSTGAEIIEKYFSTDDAEKKKAVHEEVAAAIKEKLDEHFKKVSRYRQEKFSDPIMNMTALLPKEELAHLAESLVNLTSFKRRVSLDEESVGGPIDVAVISKGDGFVWIKRKHYFRPELNSMFQGNYFRDHSVHTGETAHERRNKKAGTGTGRAARPPRAAAKKRPGSG